MFPYKSINMPDDKNIITLSRENQALRQPTEQELFDQIEQIFKTALEPVARELVEIRDNLAVTNKRLNEVLVLMKFEERE